MPPYVETDVYAHKVWRHVETDSLYVVLGIAECSTNGPRCGVERSVVYFSLTQQEWKYREVEEFLDGRFVPEPSKDGLREGG